MIQRSYYRVATGKKNSQAEDFFTNNYIGCGFDIHEDLTAKLPENWRDFNKEFIPVWLAANPGKSRIAAGLACGMLHTLCKGIHCGDIILSPAGKATYKAGKVVSDYYYNPDRALPHCRKVEWFSHCFSRNDMSPGLYNSVNARGTICQISKHAREITLLLGENPINETASFTEEFVEDTEAFGLEKHLEDFLIHNWDKTELGRKYKIYKDENGDGQQYRTDTGPIDILAISHDEKEILVVELKKGRAADVVVGQIQRYMGYISDELAKPEQKVRGLIIALEDSVKVRRALRVAPDIDFYRYKVNFKLFKSGI